MALVRRTDSSLLRAQRWESNAQLEGLSLVRSVEEDDPAAERFVHVILDTPVAGRLRMGLEEVGDDRFSLTPSLP